ncbi:MAG TPA: ATP-binding protein [Thermoanaerobaculia bacterium]|nr:ATP-binding protein [Thermoanaerobaculia bacterium]
MSTWYRPTDWADKLLIASFALAVAAFGIMAWYSWRQAERYASESHRVSHSYEVMEAARKVEAAIGAAVSVQRAYLLSGDELWILRLDSELSHLETALLNLRFLTLEEPEQQRRLDALENRLREWRDALMDNQLVRQLDGFEAAVERGRTDAVARLAAPLDASLEEFEHEERNLLRERRLAEAAARRRTAVAFVALPASAMALLGWLFLGIRKEVGQRVTAERSIAALNNSLEQRATELEAANRELESVSYTASHDLRAPLRAIASFSRILHEEHREQLDSEGQRLLRAVEKNAGKMAGLLDGLLAFSRLGRVPLKKRIIDHNDLVQRVVESLLATDDATPETRVQVGRLPECSGDPVLLGEVWSHLLRNAMKFSRDRVQPAIEVGGAEHEQDIVYHVRDNGIGFDMQHSAKLFGVFERLHQEQQYPGRGLGLAIAHRIVQRHGGRMWAEGRPDAGATFYFSLPRTAPLVPVG